MTTLCASQFMLAQVAPGEAYLTDFASWLATTGNRGRGRCNNSISAHVSDMLQFARWFTAFTGQDFSPELVTSTDLRGYFHQSAEVEHVRPATWNRRRVSLALFCDWALAAQKIVYSPFRGVPTMQETELAPHGLDKSETARFWRRAEQAVNVARTPNARRLAVRNRAMLALMLYAGLRVGEVARLDQADVQIREKSGNVTIRNSKGQKTGEVPLGREARIALTAWIELHPTQGGLMFDGITTRQIERVVEMIEASAGMDVTPHTLRHTFAYRFRETHPGEQLKLQMLMRHSRADTTAKYGRPRLEDLQAAVENL